MKKYLILPALLAMFVWSQSSYGMANILVYKGTIKAAKSIVDVNDTNNLQSCTVQGYWIVGVYQADTLPFTHKGEVSSSSCVIYNPKEKYYKVITDSVSSDPCDPCGVVILNFNPADADGELRFDVIGKGKFLKFPRDPNETTGYVPATLKGTGFVNNFDFFDPNFTYSGSITVSLTLDPKLCVPSVDYGFMITGYTTVDDVANDIVEKLTSKGGWTEWPYIPPSP